MAVHAPHCELVALVQVSGVVQSGIVVHATQAEALPMVVRKYPGDSHAVHCESKFVLQLRAEVQWSTAVQASHVPLGLRW